MAIFRPSSCGGIPEGDAAVAASAVIIAATLVVVVPHTTVDINDRRPVALVLLLLLINEVADGSSVSLTLSVVSTALNTVSIRLPLCCSCRSTNDDDNDDNDDDADNDRIEKASQEYGWWVLLLFCPTYQPVDMIKLHNPSVSNKNTLASLEVVVLNEDILIVVGCAILSILRTNK